MPADRAALLAALVEVRALLARPGNDYSWSSFADTGAALAELDGVIAVIRAGGDTPWSATVLFAPTGPIQEVAMSSGWSDEFLRLADAFDATR